MVKFMILFNRPAALPAFERNYNSFLAHIEAMPMIQRRQVVDILGTPRGEAALYRILEVYFEDYTTLQASLRSEAGQLAGKALTAFPANSFEMLFAEVYEENGGQTPA